MNNDGEIAKHRSIMRLLILLFKLNIRVIHLISERDQGQSVDRFISKMTGKVL